MSVQQISQYLENLEVVRPGDPHDAKSNDREYVPGNGDADTPGLFRSTEGDDLHSSTAPRQELEAGVRAILATKSWLISD